MSLSSSSTEEQNFGNSKYFVQSSSPDEWFCDICTPLKNGNVEYMTLRAAQHHERHSAEHAYNITDTAAQVWWDAPADPADWSLPSKYEPPLSREEMRVRESQSQVDHVHDMVPFWIKGVEAAEKGEVISSMEDFLNMLQEDPWLTGNDWGHVWGEQANAQDGWGAGNEIAWGANPKETTEHARKKEATWDSNEQHRAKGRYSEGKMPRGISRNAHEFVEDVARQQAADEEQKRRMHSFFEMSTDEKVKRIDQVIRELHRGV